jgi:hypothetical protein
VSSILFAFLFLFASFELASANITVNYTLQTVWLIIIGGFVFLFALIGWMALKWLNERKKNNTKNTLD